MSSLEQLHLDNALRTSPAGPILHKELARFWALGADDKARSVWGILAMLEANVANEKLSDESFREIAGQILQRVRTEECTEK